jgi:hypothetical protein
MSENAIQAQVMQVLKQLGICCIRINAGKVKVRGGWMQLAPEGTADLAVFPDARMPVWIEMKQPKKGPSKEQKEFQSQVERLGHRYYVVRSVDDLQGILKELK